MTTTILNSHTDWPGLAQAFQLTRERTSDGKTAVETIRGITSLSREKCDAQRLLDLTRNHWSIENGLHRVRDVTLGEDQCLARKGSTPEVLAGIRNAVVNLLRRINPKNLAAATRRLIAHPIKAIELVRGEKEN